MLAAPAGGRWAGENQGTGGRRLSQAGQASLTCKHESGEWGDASHGNLLGLTDHSTSGQWTLLFSAL